MNSADKVDKRMNNALMLLQESISFLPSHIRKEWLIFFSDLTRSFSNFSSSDSAPSDGLVPKNNTF